MKKHYLRILLAAVGFAGLGGVAQAQSHQEIVVTLPFEFVASGKTLPAGTYTVTRISENNFDLVLSNQAKHVGVLVHPIEVEDARADKPAVSFERVGESRLLSQIETADYVYNIPVSARAIAIANEAARKTGDTTSPSASGNN